jgi:fructokinase
MSTDAVVIWGELLWDRYPLAAGDQLGGAPANVAWHFGQAGGWAQLVTRVGDDADGRRAIAQLDDVVDTSLIQIDPDRATGVVTIEVERGEPRYTLHPGRAWERIACTDAVLEAIHGAGVFVYGTLSQRTAEGVAQWRLAVEAAGVRALRVYDANLRPDDQATHVIGLALEHADLIKLNDREVAQLRDLFGWSDPIAQLRAPAASGVRTRSVVVTHGAAGSTIYPVDGAPIDIAAVPAMPGGDNVGCGDAYLALLLFGMTSGWDLTTSGRVASRWAAAVAGVRGATPRFDDERVAELLEPA